MGMKEDLRKLRKFTNSLKVRDKKIYRYAEESENKDAAAAFVKWFTLGKGSDMWLEINGDVPSRLDKQQEIQNDANASKDMKIAAYEAANTAVPRAVTPLFGEYSTALNEAWEDVRNGADIKDTLNQAIEKYKTAVDSAKK